MIKVEKTTENIPEILNNDATTRKRNNLIRAKRWLSSSSYKAPYQSRDVKKQLKAIYNSKCAYCEQRVQLPKKKQNKSFSNDLTTEHYRPKAEYWWLAYSWDNLLPVCYDCNRAKEDDFKIEGTRIANIRERELENIHQLAESYNKEEKPIFIHPELENYISDFIFDGDGGVSSKHLRCEYVIKKCDLERDKLTQMRWEIIKKYRVNFQEIVRSSTSNEAFEAAFKDFILQLKKDSQNPKKTFLALRIYILKNFKKMII